MKNESYPFTPSPSSPPLLPPFISFFFPLFLPISYLSLIWRTQADAGLSLEVSGARAAIFFLLITAQSPTQDTSKS